MSSFYAPRHRADTARWHGLRQLSLLGTLVALALVTLAQGPVTNAAAQPRAGAVHALVSDSTGDHVDVSEAGSAARKARVSATVDLVHVRYVWGERQQTLRVVFRFAGPARPLAGMRRSLLLQAQGDGPSDGPVFFDARHRASAVTATPTGRYAKFAPSRCAGSEAKVVHRRVVWRIPAACLPEGSVRLSSSAHAKRGATSARDVTDDAVLDLRR